MNKKPILSIIIPTYNRVKFLETTVNVFISQITEGNFENQVEIVIGNDASPENKTREYLEKLETSHPFIKTFTNTENFGLSGNVVKLVNMAQAKFVWLFGEDDLITPLSLKRVLKSIEAENPNIIMFNTANIISSDDRNLEYKIIGKNRLDLTEDVLIKSFETGKTKLSSIKNWLYLTNLVSSSAFRKDLFLDLLPKAKKYVRFESVYLFQAPLIIGIAKYGRLKIIAERSVLHRKNETHWSKNFESKLSVSLYDGSEIVRLIRNYMPSEYKNYQKILTSHTFGIIRTAKKEGHEVTKYIIDAVRKYYSCYPYNIRLILMLFIPKIIFKFFKKL